MTAKQEVILKKYLHEEQIDKLRKNNQAYHFIGMIEQIRVVDFKKRIGVAKDILTPIEINAIEQYVNLNISKYSKITDETAYVADVYDLLGVKKIRMEQYWFKGESSSRSYNSFFVDSDGNRLNITQYDRLVDLDIYSISDLINYFLKL